MSVHATSSRSVLVGAAVLALAVAAGCSSAKEPTAAPKASAPSVSASPSETPSETPTETPTETAAAAVAPGSDKLTAAGTSLKIGQSATVQIGYTDNLWVGGIKVTSLKKAPASDFKELDVRDDAGSVYYLRYDVTYLSGKTKYPPTGGDVSFVRLHPLGAQGQKLSLVGRSTFKKCTTTPYLADGNIDSEKQALSIGETLTNQCRAFLVSTGTLTQVVHTFYDTVKKADQVITWK